MSTTTASTTWSSAPARTTRRRSSPIRARRQAARGAFETELARFEAFDSAARGGVSVAASQIDGSTADNIIVGSGPGMPSEVKVFRSDLPSSPGTAPALFSTFSPYPDDQLRRERRSGFVDFATGRYSIVTAPGAWQPGAGEGVRLPADDADRATRPRPQARPRADQCRARRQQAGSHQPPSCRSASAIRVACPWPPAGSPARSAAPSGSSSASSPAPAR